MPLVMGAELGDRARSFVVGFAVVATTPLWIMPGVRSLVRPRGDPLAALPPIRSA